MLIPADRHRQLHAPAWLRHPARGLGEIQATLTLGSPLRDSSRRRTPVLPLTITA